MEIKIKTEVTKTLSNKDFSGTMVILNGKIQVVRVRSLKPDNHMFTMKFDKVSGRFDSSKSIGELIDLLSELHNEIKTSGG